MMTPTLKWRIVTLQIALVVVLTFSAGFLYWAAAFTHGYVHDELSAQQVRFPAATSPALTALPAADAQAMTHYAGQALDNGAMAKVYANNFIAVHLRAAAGGHTYAQESALAQAKPTDQKLAQTVQTLFRGETLRGLLLNAWGWWTVGTYALYAALGLTLAVLAVLGTLVYEVVVAPNRASIPTPTAVRRAGLPL